MMVLILTLIVIGLTVIIILSDRKSVELNDEERRRVHAEIDSARASGVLKPDADDREILRELALRKGAHQAETLRRVLSFAVGGLGGLALAVTGLMSTGGDGLPSLGGLLAIVVGFALIGFGVYMLVRFLMHASTRPDLSVT